MESWKLAHANLYFDWYNENGTQFRYSLLHGADEFLEFVRRSGARPRMLIVLPSFAWSLATTEFLLRMDGGTAVMVILQLRR
jgi:hypothetical protein